MKHIRIRKMRLEIDMYPAAVAGFDQKAIIPLHDVFDIISRCETILNHKNHIIALSEKRVKYDKSVLYRWFNKKPEMTIKLMGQMVVPFSFNMGVCHNVGTAGKPTAFMYYLNREISNAWMESKGIKQSPTFPLKGGATLYTEQSSSGTMWLNEERWEYLEFTKTFLENIINE